MATIPKTSVSLIAALKDDPQSRRWDELYSRYEAPMRAFLAARHPTLEPDDIIQETMLALMRRMPGYHYTPDDKGHFRNYLLGILAHKAADAIAARTRESDARKRMREDPSTRAGHGRTNYEKWKESAVEVAIAQLMADESVNALHRTVFRHVALMHEQPEAVAAQFGISRENVDQIKRRIISRLGEIVKKMTDCA